MAKPRATIGQMREKIQIITLSTTPVGVYSGQDTYSVDYTMRARVRSMSGAQEKNGIGYSDSERTHIIIIRNGSHIKIDKNNMIIWDTRFYKIIRGPERIGRTLDDPKKRYLRMEVVYDSEHDGFVEEAP